MTDRDHFAAAALTGLINTHAVYHKEPPSLAVMAFAAADAMLREREKREPVAFRDGVPVYSTNHDAAPAAKANAESVVPQPTAGDRSGNPTSHSGTGKQPAPPCVETDGFSSDSRTGQINRTPECESPRRECGESSRRDVPQPDNGRAAGGPAHHISKAEIDALQHVVEDGRLVDLADYGRLRSLLVRLRPEWEQEDGESDRPEPIKDAESDRPQPISTDTTPPPHATPPQGSVPGKGSVRDSRNANEPVAWAVVTAKGLTNVCILQAVANDWASHHGGEVIPLFAKDKNFSPQAASNSQLLDAIQSLVDQTDPWLSQATDREYKIHTPEHRNARRAVKELRRRLK